MSEHFFGCYLLVSENAKYQNHTYIGFTVNPNRRINQHNKGIKSGGARKTNNKGPWSMILIVHGFPNEISALRFEWAWQHPNKSTRLRNLTNKKAKETQIEHKLRILEEMLSTGPWNRLALTIRWLDPKYQMEFKKKPPTHMPITQGEIQTKKVANAQPETRNRHNVCVICKKSIKDASDQLQCFVPGCNMIGHVLCWAKSSSDGFLIPTEVKCTQCKSCILWGDLIRHQKECYKDLND